MSENDPPMEGSVLSFLKAEWKVSDTDSAHGAFNFNLTQVQAGLKRNWTILGQ